jgi:hypothetical protein
MRFWTGVLLLCLTALASAQVFRSVGPDGTVQFSDQPAPGATSVDVQPAQTVPMGGPILRSPAPAAAKEPGGPVYGRFEILSPTADEGVRANDGNVTVSLALDPPLLPGHRVVVLVDGRPVGSPDASLQVALTNLDRGTHRVEASVVNAGGQALASAGPLTFHVLRVHLPPQRATPK